MQDFNLLPQEKSFRQLLLPFMAPYFLYVLLASMPSEYISAESIQVVTLIFVSLVMVVFRKNYRFGRFKIIYAGVAVLTTPIAVILWIFPLYLIGNAEVMVDPGAALLIGSPVYFYVKIINTTILVALFEELLMRVFLMELFHQAGQQIKKEGVVDSILNTFDQKPLQLLSKPLSLFSLAMTTLFFTGGHTMPEYLSALLYFSFTNLLYKIFGSVWVCVIVHGAVNFVIAILVKYYAMEFLWF
ncbi:MAG: CPBP family glutamic-type intramembrane protease [Thermodesulfobacteriota bacterium]|nr:CPBP family glutamic-type intramembrane protease [Thermodesulfobacteriota bacterium]